jgi:outer membrane lipoprotein
VKAVLLLVATTLAACAHPPQPIDGRFPPVQVPDVQGGQHTGERVRWGGVIVETRPEQDRTCFELVSLPLDARARPRVVDQTYGRFEACAPGFYDPEIYEPRREVTVVGTVQDVVTGKVGEYDYRFPRLAAEMVYLWPPRPDPGAYYGVYPYWDPWPYSGWGWGWGVGWNADWHGGWHGGGGGGGPMVHHQSR